MENEKFQELVLEHLARLTQEITEIKQNGVETNQRLDRVEASTKQRLDRIEASVIRIENDHGEKLKALFDGHEVMMDRTERLMESQTRIEAKLDRLSLRVSANEAELRKAK